jgi:hypothetical protein
MGFKTAKIRGTLNSGFLIDIQYLAFTHTSLIPLIRLNLAMTSVILQFWQQTTPCL